MKRLIDAVISAAGLILLAPLLLLVSIAIWLADGRPVLFRQRRVGKKGAQFEIAKFRTMTSGRATRGRGITVGDDTRVTPIGRLLRRLKIDELPQLWNVLRGDMSLVGPRPELPEYVAFYPVSLRGVLDFKPGITDPASLLFRHESDLLQDHPSPERFYREKVLPAKLKISFDYAMQATVWTDFRVAIASLACLLPNAASAGAQLALPLAGDYTEK